jgi:RNA polymerase sigma factor (sigma-70 family)
MAMLPAQAPSDHGPIEQIRPRLAGSRRRSVAGRSDESLVAIAREGDERAFEMLYERHGPAILRYCRSLLRSTQEAEDVKQEVFVLAISALRRGAQPDAFRPWLYRVAHNACMSHLRIRRPVLVADNGVLVGPAAAAEPVDGHREELRQLLDDIGKLPDVQRGALLLREMDGFSYEQVGEVLGLPLSTVRASIFRARRTLQGLAEARDADCEAIQSELCRLADRRGRRARHITTHLNVCAACRDFRDGLRRRPAVLGGVQPAAPLGAGGLYVALKGKLLGGSAAGGAGAALAAGGGGAGVAKITAVVVSSIALLAGAGIDADRVIEHSHREAAAARRHVAPARALPSSAPRAVSAAAPASAAGADAARRAGRIVAARPGAVASAPAGARAHTRARHATADATVAAGHGTPRATAPAAGVPVTPGPSAPGAGRDHGSSSRPDERGDDHRGSGRRHSSPDDGETASGSEGSSGSGDRSSGTTRERTDDTSGDAASGTDASRDAGVPAVPPDDTSSSPPHASGPSSPTQTAPAPSSGSPGPPPPGSGTTSPPPPTAPTPAPPTDPALPAPPPADPGATGTTTTTALPADPAAAVVPAP